MASASTSEDMVVAVFAMVIRLRETELDKTVGATCSEVLLIIYFKGLDDS